LGKVIMNNSFRRKMNANYESISVDTQMKGNLMADWFNLYFKKSQVGCNAKQGWKNCHKFKSQNDKPIEEVVNQVEELNLNNLVNIVLADPTNELGSYSVNTTTQLIL